MVFYISGAILLTLVYIFILVQLIEGWNSLPVWDTLKKTVATSVSVLVPARNEEGNIGCCLEAILAQNYPLSLVEIIVIDDFSTDSTAEIVERYSYSSSNVHLIKLADQISPDSTQSFKKKALDVAIKKATGKLIITTDADCTMGPNWLRYLISYYEIHQPKFMAAPVVFQDEKNTFQLFQSLDFMGMMGVTGAGIHKRFLHMCNGANLAYERKVFHEVGGFNDVDHLASGDDMMLLQKIAKQYPQKIAFIKQAEAVTFTSPKRTFQSFMNQRLRWATKTTSYQEWKVTLIWALVWLFSLSIPVSLLLGFFWPVLFWVFVGQLIVKMVIDYIFLRRMALFFNRRDLISTTVYLASVFWELFYVITIGFLGNIKREYEWKGRKVK